MKKEKEKKRVSKTRPVGYASMKPGETWPPKRMEIFQARKEE